MMMINKIITVKRRAVMMKLHRNNIINILLRCNSNLIKILKMVILIFLQEVGMRMEKMVMFKANYHTENILKKILFKKKFQRLSKFAKKMMLSLGILSSQPVINLSIKTLLIHLSILKIFQRLNGSALMR